VPLVTRCKVEVSPDPLSVIFPTYYDVSPYLESVEWGAGKSKELDGVQAGYARAVFDNDSRRFDLLDQNRQTLTVSGNEITDALRVSGPTGDGRAYRNQRNIYDMSWVGQTTLDGAINSSVTTMTISAWPENPDGSSPWPTDSAFRLMIDNETVMVTGGWLTNVLNITRGVTQHWGSAQAAASHSDGAVVTNVQSPPDGWEFKAVSLGGKIADQAEVVTGADGLPALKMTVHPGDQNDAADATRERIEMYWTGDVGATGETRVYSWSDEFPDDFSENNEGCFIGQIGPNHNSGTAAVYVRVASTDRFQLGFNAGVLDTGTFVGTFTDEYTFDTPVTNGTRHDFRLEIEWQLTATGHLKFWHREQGGEWELLLDLTGITTSSSLSGSTPAIKRKHGIYRNAHATKTNYLLLSRVRQAPSWRDSILDAPGGDSSFGIWATADNILTADLGEGGSSAAGVDDTDYQFMGAAMKLVTFDATNDNWFRTFSGLTIGNVYTAHGWVDRHEIDARFLKVQVRNAANNATVAETNVRRQKGRQHVTVTFTATDTTGRVRLIATDSQALPILAWAGRFQLEAGAIATPFAGYSAARSNARVRIPVDDLDETQGWVAMRVRPGWSPAAEALGGSGILRLFLWSVDGNNRISGYYSESTGLFTMRRKSGGSGSDATVAPSFVPESEVTVVFAWTATQVKVSVNGGTFQTASNSSIPDLSSITDVDIGSNGGGSEHLDGDVLWFAYGHGTLDDDDAAALAEFREDDPWAHDFDLDAGVISTWDAVSATAGASFTDLWRRMRITLEDDSRTVQQGVYYLLKPTLNFVGKTKFSQVQFDYVDGVGLLASQHLPRMNPPDAESYLDVADYDGPTMLYELAERGGTKVVQHAYRKRKRRKGESRRHYRRHGFRRWHTRETRPEVEGQAGPTGTYKETPSLGQPSLIVGSDSTCVSFARANEEHVLIHVEDPDDYTLQNFSLEAWVQPVSIPGTGYIWSGPENTSVTNEPIWALGYDSTTVFFAVEDGLGFTDISAAFVVPTTTPTHIVGTCDNTGAVTLYINGVQVATGTTAGPITPQGDKIYIGNNGGNLSTRGVNGRIQCPAFYPVELSAERVLAHYLAGSARGYGVQSAGARVAAVSASPLWDTDRIDTNGYDVQPIFTVGQSPLDEIDAAAEAEMPDALYFFDNDGQPVYLPVGYKATTPYNAVTVTVATNPANGIPYDDDKVDWDNELYNVVPCSADGGTEQLAVDATSQAERGDHVFQGGTGLLNNDDADVLAIAETIRDRYSGVAPLRPFEVTLHGVVDEARQHIMEREIGDLVGYVRERDTGDALNVQARILGYVKRYEKGQVTCTWSLGRGESIGSSPTPEEPPPVVPERMGLKGLRVDSQLSLAALQAKLDEAQDTYGAELIRVSCFWDTIELSDGSFTWTKPDAVVSECQARDLDVVFHIAQAPSWVGVSGWNPPVHNVTQLGHWHDFMQALAGRYGTDVRLYEVWNEPNGNSFWASGSATAAKPGEYADLLRYAHDGLRAGNPDVTISAMNMNRGHVSGWMNEVYDALEADMGVSTCQANGYYYDVLSLHPYCLTHQPNFAAGGDDIADSWGGVIGRSFQDYRRARDLVFTREGVHKDVFMGEWGQNTDGSSNNGPVTDAQRALNIVQAFDLIRADGFVIGLVPYSWHQATSAWDIAGTATGTAFAGIAPGAP